jgi:hypothetical protein
MSDELRLPDRLAACEAELAAQSLPASTINRDELLYRAGWAAAEAALANRAVDARSASVGDRASVARWSAASAALAASIAVAVTLAISGGRADRSLAEGQRETLPVNTASIASSTPSGEADGRRRVVVDPLLERLDAFARGTGAARGSVREASIWAATRRPRVGRSDQPILVSVEARSLAPSAIDGTTAHELMDQLLPGSAKAAGDAGEASGVLKFLYPQGWGGDAI